jgi:CPA1 family monovalent cation:H+ antiporter
MISRRAVLERLIDYNGRTLRPFVGDRMAEVLEGILRGRLEAVDGVLAQLRKQYPGHTSVLERRLLVLFALGRGARIIESMKAESIVSAEVALRLEASLRETWEANIPRPVPPLTENSRG